MELQETITDYKTLDRIYIQIAYRKYIIYDYIIPIYNKPSMQLMEVSCLHAAGTAIRVSSPDSNACPRNFVLLWFHLRTIINASLTPFLIAIGINPLCDRQEDPGIQAGRVRYVENGQGLEHPTAKFAFLAIYIG